MGAITPTIESMRQHTLLQKLQEAVFNITDGTMAGTCRDVDYHRMRDHLQVRFADGSHFLVTVTPVHDFDERFPWKEVERAAGSNT